MTEPKATLPKIFISYSHLDELWKDRIVRHLKAAAREGNFEIWDDRCIRAGEPWHPEIIQAIAGCKLALLLVSADFLASEFIVNEEIPHLLERQEAGRLHVFPVILKACLWQRIPWLARLQVRPLDGVPLSSFDGYLLEEELTRIAGELWSAVEATSSIDISPSVAQFLVAYRHRLFSAFSRWDLGNIGVPQTGGGNRPVDAELDTMYLPLRLAEGFDLSKTDRGRVITPEDLLQRTRPLTVRGPAGSGKTTWMRWTFRRLLRVEGAFPVLLILRDLARSWKGPSCQGAARSLDSYLHESIAAQGLSPAGALQALFSSPKAPRPVLLVDGWDEVGPLGEELRQKLAGFLREHPRVLAIVTSRPYGEGCPSHSEGYEVLDIQPLADSEIADLARCFFLSCSGDDKETVQREADRFQRELRRSPEAEALARVVLLLTMMLMISRSRPLPDKRHLLYEACIENLLSASQSRKEEEGALLSRDQWRPEDSEERLRVVAALAAELQEVSYGRSGRSPVVGTWEELAVFLPAGWTENRRQGFLAWLAGPAGLLTDRADGTLVFSHLSFQEYLTAWHLNARIDGAEQRVEAFVERTQEQNWWETLRLWAALIQRHNRERLDAVLCNLTERGGYCAAFSGTVFADGLGAEEHFRKWMTRLMTDLELEWAPSHSLCATAWSASRQDDRRDKLSRLLSDVAVAWPWWTYLRARIFAAEASLKIAPPLRSSSRALAEQLEGGRVPLSAPESVAYGRILCGGPGLWPVDLSNVGLLQAWPGNRRRLGLRLQMAQIYGADRSELFALASGFLQRTVTAQDLASARLLARELASRWVRYWPRDWARWLARDWAFHWADCMAHTSAQSWARFWGRFWARFWARFWGRETEGELVRAWAHEVACETAHERCRDWTRYWGCNWVRDWADDLKMDPQPAWFGQYAAGELYSLGRVQARWSLARPETEAGLPEKEILKLACRSSTVARVGPEDLAGLDPLWAALARHMARASTQEDQEFLADLAEHPEKRSPPLSWGLQFIVRGDVMMEDGSIVTLDEFAEAAGLPRLPYLEDMPEELRVLWTVRKRGGKGGKKKRKQRQKRQAT